MSSERASHRERARALAILRRHGWNATSFQALEQGFSYWFDGDEAVVAYVDTGGAWVAAGAPVAEPERLGTIAAHFVADARRHGRRACFFATEARLALVGGIQTLLIGEQPIWDPALWDATLREKRSLREQLRRARAKGVTIRTLDAAAVTDPEAPARQAIETLIQRWLGSRSMAPMGFLVALEPFDFPDERRYFLAEQQGRAVAFLAAVPIYARGGWLIEDLVRDPAAPNGTTEMLIDAAFRSAEKEGSRYVTLGLAPLAGTVPVWLRLTRAVAGAIYDFEGLRAFKARLRPQAWDPIYLAFPVGASGTLAIYDALMAFARGSFVRFGIESVLRGPAVVVRLLAALLVPWTMLLALADTHQWFPSLGIQYAWVAFDAGLIALLFGLANHWRRWLGVTLAVCITTDAVLTLLEALLYNLPRVHGVGAASVIAVACLAPALAALVLCGALRSRTEATQLQ